MARGREREKETLSPALAAADHSRSGTNISFKEFKCSSLVECGHGTSESVGRLGIKLSSPLPMPHQRGYMERRFLRTPAELARSVRREGRRDGGRRRLLSSSSFVRSILGTFCSVRCPFSLPSLRDRNCLLMRASVTERAVCLEKEEAAPSLHHAILPCPSLFSLLPKFCFGAAKSMPRTASIKSGRTLPAAQPSVRPVKSSSSPSLSS